MVSGDSIKGSKRLVTTCRVTSLYIEIDTDIHVAEVIVAVPRDIHIIYIKMVDEINKRFGLELPNPSAFPFESPATVHLIRDSNGALLQSELSPLISETDRKMASE